MSNKIDIGNDNLIECEELLLRNTFLNAQMGPIAIYKFDEVNQNKIENRLKWIDTHNKTNQLRTNDSEDDLIFKDQPEPIMSHKQQASLKPIMKINENNQENNGLKLNFYKPTTAGGASNEQKTDQNLNAENFDTKATVDAIARTNTICEIPNYDPMVGNKTLGNTMPLPRNNNLLENKNEKENEEISTKKFIDKIKEGDGVPTKKIVREKNKRMYNYIVGK